MATGKSLNSAAFKYYHIDEAGSEKVYFSVVLEHVKVESITSLMYDINDDYGKNKNHLECIDLAYEKITWHYLDGNVIHSDSWSE